MSREVPMQVVHVRLEQDTLEVLDKFAAWAKLERSQLIRTLLKGWASKPKVREYAETGHVSSENT